jgi:CBS domain-containing protein
MEPKENAVKARAVEKRVKEIMEPAIAVSSEESAQDAMDKIAAEQGESAPVTDTEGTLLGRVSTDRLNSKVGGLGHDPKSTDVKSEIEESACCFEDQTVDEVEQVMHEAKVQELPVVNQDKRLLGKANLAKIKEEKRKEGS